MSKSPRAFTRARGSRYRSRRILFRRAFVAGAIAYYDYAVLPILRGLSAEGEARIKRNVREWAAKQADLEMDTPREREED